MNNKYLLAILLCSSPLVADEKSPGVFKIIEGRKIVAETAEGKEVEAKLTNLRNELDQELTSLENKLKNKASDLQKKVSSRILDDKELIEKQHGDILRESKELEVKKEAAQEEFQRAVQRELGKFNVEIKKTVEQVAKEKGWDLVKIKETGEIVYSSPKVDCSNEIIEAHDKNFKLKKSKGEDKAPVNVKPKAPKQ